MVDRWPYPLVRTLPHQKDQKGVSRVIPARQLDSCPGMRHASGMFPGTKGNEWHETGPTFLAPLFPYFHRIMDALTWLFLHFSCISGPTGIWTAAFLRSFQRGPNSAYPTAMPRCMRAVLAVLRAPVNDHQFSRIGAGYAAAVGTSITPLISRSSCPSRLGQLLPSPTHCRLPSTLLRGRPARLGHRICNCLQQPAAWMRTRQEHENCDVDRKKNGIDCE